MSSTDPEVRQFVRGEPDGPIKFHYPAKPLGDDFGIPGGGSFTVEISDEPHENGIADWHLLLEDETKLLLEDLGRTHAALEAYQAAVGEDPSLADGHYNLARIYESLGQPQHAIRHLGQYRRLLNSESR